MTPIRTQAPADDYLEPIPQGPMTVAELMDALAAERKRLGPDAKVYIWPEVEAELVPISVINSAGIIVINAREP